jgi:type VI secretion system secreted protein Hcp
MFLNVENVTGEARDELHKGEIEVVSWSWGMQATTDVATGEVAGRAKLSELHIVKRVDQSSPTLMTFLKNNKVAKYAKLTVRKAGGPESLEYLKIELSNARVTAVKLQSENSELVEHLSLGFSKVKVSYVPQSSTGARGGGANEFEADAHVV